VRLGSERALDDVERRGVREEVDQCVAEHREVVAVVGRDVETGGEGGGGDLDVQEPRLGSAVPAASRGTGQHAAQATGDERGATVEGDDGEGVTCERPWSIAPGTTAAQRCSRRAVMASSCS
jgi:hypothetical protein